MINSKLKNKKMKIIINTRASKVKANFCKGKFVEVKFIATGNKLSEAKDIKDKALVAVHWMMKVNKAME